MCFIINNIQNIQRSTIAIIAIPYLLVIYSCNKAVQIPPPNNTITTSQVFADSSDLAAAISGIYSKVLGGNINNIGFCNGAQTLYCGTSSDELIPFNSTGDPQQFYFNNLVDLNGLNYKYFWQQPYAYIYQTNACIEGIPLSKSLSTSVQNRFLGEAKFLRALFYFYLVNIFGDVPYVTSTSWESTSLSKRSPMSDVYQGIISDLKDAQNYLPEDYSFSSGLRTRANKWAATALLARVYLYTKDWNDAAIQASSIISNSGLFSLVSDPNQVFSISSSEAILQWQLNTSYSTYTATPEGYKLVPIPNRAPQYYLSPYLLNSFEPNDIRKLDWIDSVKYAGKQYYTPYKYKIGVKQYVPKGNASEYYTVLRLAEQYLIRAEAEANGANGGMSAAIDDLNVIRSRAGLDPYSGASDQTSILSAILHERQIELFAEWGHRWFDLKRTGAIDSIMSVVTPQKSAGGNWNNYQQFYPIPRDERLLDPNLTQNNGYE